MGRKSKEDQVDGAPDQDEPVDFGNRPEIATADLPDMETLSHNWQPGSPAVDMRDVAKPLNAENLVAKLAAEESGEMEDGDKAADKPKLTADEHKERTQLDVSDPRYVNPSLDHHDVTE